MASIDQLAQILQMLMSNNNALRRNAEKQFEALTENEYVLSTLSHLLVILRTAHAEVIIRVFAAVLMRRVVEKIVEHLPANEVLRLKHEFVDCWRSLTDLKLSTKMSHVLAQMAFKHPWPELLPAAINVGMSSATHVLPTLNLVQILADYTPEDIQTHHAVLVSFLATHLASQQFNVKLASARATTSCILAIEEASIRNTYRPALPSILSILTECLTRGDEPDAINLLTPLVDVVYTQSMFFKPHLDQTLQTMLTIISNREYEASTRHMCMEWILGLCEVSPGMARKAMGGGLGVGLVGILGGWMCSIRTNPKTWCSVPYTLEDDGGVSGDGDDGDEDQNMYVYGDDGLERLVASLGGEKVGGTILALAQAYATSNPSHTPAHTPTWVAKRAALALLGAYAEGSAEHFAPHIGSMVEFIRASLLQHSSDPMSVRLTYECVYRIGRLGMLYPAHLVSLLQTFVPLLVGVLQGGGGSHGVWDGCMRLRGHAASALISLLHPDELEDGEGLAPLLPPLLEALLGVLKGGVGAGGEEVQAQVLVVIGLCAQIAPQTFTPYYPHLLPPLKQLLLSALPSMGNGNTLTLAQIALRNKCLECAGLVLESMGGAVGGGLGGQQVGEVVRADISDMVNICLQYVQHDTTDDITYAYTLPCLVRMMKITDFEFGSYLTLIWQKIVKVLGKEVAFKMEDVLDGDDGDNEDNEDDDADNQAQTKIQSTTLDLPDGSRKKISIDAQLVQQQLSAIRILYEIFTMYAQKQAQTSSKHTLSANMCMDAITLLTPLLTSPYSPDIRTHTAMCMSLALGSLIKEQGNANPLLEVFTHITKQLMLAVVREGDGEVRSAMLESWRDVLTSVYEGGAKGGDGRHYAPYPVLHSGGLPLLQEGVGGVLQVMADAFVAYRKAGGGNKSEEEDEDDEEGSEGEEAEEAHNILTLSIEVLGGMCKLSRVGFLQSFMSALRPALQTYLNPTHPPSLQVLAYSLYIDVLEFAHETGAGLGAGVSFGEVMADFLPPAMQVVSRCATNPPEGETERHLFQCALYGIAIAFRYPPSPASSHVLYQSSTLLGVLSFLQHILQKGEAWRGEGEGEEGEKWGGVYDNALYTLTCLLTHPFYPAVLTPILPNPVPTLASLYSSLFQALPVRTDEMEYEDTLHLISSAIVSAHPFIGAEGTARETRVSSDVIKLAYALLQTQVGRSMQAAGEEYVLKEGGIQRAQQVMATIEKAWGGK
eukprot:gene24779-29942_t